MNVRTLIEHLANVAIQGHANAEVMIQTGLTLTPLAKGDVGLMSNGKKGLVLYPREESHTQLQHIGNA